MSLQPTVRTPRNPALREHAKERRAKFENRLADTITRFAGSMDFVYLSIVWYGLWIAIPLEEYPFGLLTMIVSLEAIFLSTFILISQNRQAEKDRVRSNIDYEVNVKAELEVAHLHEKTDRLQEKMLEEFARIRKSIESGRDDKEQKPRFGRI